MRSPAVPAIVAVMNCFEIVMLGSSSTFSPAHAADAPVRSMHAHAIVE